jgi:uncharacterized membrane protein
VIRQQVTKEQSMRSATPQFFPMIIPMLLIFFLFIMFAVVLVEVGFIEYAYERIGIRSKYMFSLLVLSLLGSYINIPVATLGSVGPQAEPPVSRFGLRHVMPRVPEGTPAILAVNLGGAVIPSLVSVYLLVTNDLFGPGLLGVAIVAGVVHWMARPIAGVGIAMPMFIPPVVAAVTAFVLSDQYAPALAYSAGSLGTLIGADLLNLHKLTGLGAPVASIGGAGTFDGIFVTGILAAVLA